MILVDTNVISEPMRDVSNNRVIKWIDAQAVETLFLSAISVAEVRFGIAVLPSGKRRERLHDRLVADLLPLFAGRILPFDLAASNAYAKLMAHARSAGKTIFGADGYIAAIAASNGFSIATRNASPFEAAGLTVINPWTEIS